jgi:hypothetical protein
MTPRWGVGAMGVTIHSWERKELAMSTLDYYIWKHDDGKQWAWEVVRVDDDGDESILAAGLAPTADEAKQCVKRELRKR